MDVLDADSPPLPQERSSNPASLNAGCLLVCGIALFPALYVGSFAALLLDKRVGGPFLRSLDDGFLEILNIIYWPLIWLCENYLF